MEILPPFATPVGRVGLSICFDVSQKAKRPAYQIKLTFGLTVTLPRDQSGSEAPERGGDHVSFSVHSPNWKCTLGSSASCKGYRDTILCDSSSTGRSS